MLSDFIERISKEVQIRPAELVRIFANFGIISIIGRIQGTNLSFRNLEMKDAVAKFVQADREERTRLLERFYFEVQSAVKDYKGEWNEP